MRMSLITAPSPKLLIYKDFFEIGTKRGKRAKLLIYKDFFEVGTKRGGKK